MATAGSYPDHPFTPSHHDPNVCIFPHRYTVEKDGFDMLAQCGHTLDEHQEQE